MKNLFTHTLPGSLAAGFVAFLLMIADLMAYRAKLPIAGVIENWLFVFIEVLAILVVSKNYFKKMPDVRVSRKLAFGVAAFISLCFSVSWSLTTYIFIKILYPGFGTEMIGYLYHPSPAATAAENNGLYLGALFSVDAYYGSMTKFITGVILGLLISSFYAIYSYRKMMRAAAAAQMEAAE
jgi:hypothetical protein